MDTRIPNHEELLASRVKEREMKGFSFSAEEVMAMARNALGITDDLAEASGGIVIDPNTNFDDPNTWM